MALRGYSWIQSKKVGATQDIHPDETFLIPSPRLANQTVMVNRCPPVENNRKSKKIPASFSCSGKRRAKIRVTRNRIPGYFRCNIGFIPTRAECTNEMF